MRHVFASRAPDGQKRIPLAEWMAGDDAPQENLFRDRDANKDDVVTLDKALAYGRKHRIAKQTFREADTNREGKPTCDELSARYASKEGPDRENRQNFSFPPPRSAERCAFLRRG